MNGTATKLPTAANSYYTVCKAGEFWAVELVNPVPGSGALRTKLRMFSDRKAAVANGRETAARAHRPFRNRGRNA